ncbi:uncharacterized protein LOC107880006 [Capsicum annuum]|uniref:uncharacterized protein LOC107880006 n=1 Tax=Capsicum annuum TaxID=4072 RepID=UPI001FB1070C|nr:uncharacterized protein LOC107880006 [Capsicum annuum]
MYTSFSAINTHEFYHYFNTIVKLLLPAALCLTGIKGKIAVMVHFKNYTSLSSNNKYLFIEADDGTILSKLLTYTPLVSKCADPWPSLVNTLHMPNWTFEHDLGSNRSVKVWTLQAPNQRPLNVASTLPCLGHRILQGDIRWGSAMEIEGEFRHIQGYWEWAEDVLYRSQQTLKAAKVYDVVYASLFTYDRSSNILQAFVEAWCSRTNTFLTSIGELSISLRDLHEIGGLPIRGLPYEEVVLEFKDLNGVDNKNERFIPCTCEFLFLAFQRLQEGESHNSRVTLCKWIKFFCKRVLRYEADPVRKEKKSIRLKSTHNPTGTIPSAAKWSSADDVTFSTLRVGYGHRVDTYLAAFLSCWLCSFVFPSKDGDFIRPGTFRIAAMIANSKLLVFSFLSCQIFIMV